MNLGGQAPFLQKQSKRFLKSFLTVAALFPIVGATHWLFDNGYGEGWFLAAIVLTLVYCASACRNSGEVIDDMRKARATVRLKPDTATTSSSQSSDFD
jgi:hypothetical protein